MFRRALSLLGVAIALLLLGLEAGVRTQSPTPLPQDRVHGLTGHLGVQVNRNQGPPPGFGYGFGFYSLIHELNQVQALGLQLGWGSWMMPDNRSITQPLCPPGTYARDHWPERGPSYRDVYQNIEGGVGQWVSTKFPSALAKFRVNATPDCYSHQIASSAWSFGADLLPPDKLGLAQLSNRLLQPPDGFVFRATSAATYLGNAWMALPLIPASVSPTGVPTGDQSWTLFLHAANFQGPVVFYTPETWSLLNAVDRTGVGRGHDAQPMFAGGVALEMGMVPTITSQSASGQRFRRIPRLAFPADANGESVLIQDVRFYSKAAIWDAVAQGFESGEAPANFVATGAVTPTLDPGTIGLTMDGARVNFDPAMFSAISLRTAGGGSGFGFRWRGSLAPGVFPEYYEESSSGWSPLRSAVPPETRLAEQVFLPAPRASYPALDQSASSPWRPSGWRAGPFTTTLSDGSIVQYVWYKFIEQPAIVRLGLSAATLSRLQTFVESWHQSAGLTGATIAPPTSGSLATLDDAQFVTPPTGLEKGYVPVAIRQL